MSKNKPAPSKPNRNYSAKTLKILFTMSRNECAWPECINPVVMGKTEDSEALVVGQIAHVFAASDDGPRGNSRMTEKERNHHDNLLLFCPTHHVIVDGQHETYPASLLLKWKAQHERWFQVELGDTIGDIGFAELEVAAKALMTSGSVQGQDDLRQIPPEQKIAKNGLGTTASMLLKMGAAKSADVEEVLLKAAQLDAAFPDRLREGFVARYVALSATGLQGDDLFFAVYDWAGGANSNKQRNAAGLCVLAHLFIICDVFEK